METKAALQPAPDVQHHLVDGSSKMSSIVCATSGGTRMGRDRQARTNKHCRLLCTVLMNRYMICHVACRGVVLCQTCWKLLRCHDRWCVGGSGEASWPRPGDGGLKLKPPAGCCIMSGGGGVRPARVHNGLPSCAMGSGMPAHWFSDTAIEAERLSCACHSKRGRLQASLLALSRFNLRLTF